MLKQKKNLGTIKTSNHLGSLKRLLAWVGLAVIIAVGYALFSPFVYADGDSKSEKAAKEKTAKVTSADEQKPKQEKLTGQDLYAIHCSRCHSERYPTEWTPAHWRTVMTHMRVRANLPAAQAKEILKYLEQDAGN